MVLAQALGEYAALSVLSTAVSSAFASARTYIGDIEPTTWALIAGGVLLLWALIGRVR